MSLAIRNLFLLKRHSHSTNHIFHRTSSTTTKTFRKTGWICFLEITTIFIILENKIRLSDARALPSSRLDAAVSVTQTCRASHESTLLSQQGEDYLELIHNNYACPRVS